VPAAISGPRHRHLVRVRVTVRARVRVRARARGRARVRVSRHRWWRRRRRRAGGHRRLEGGCVLGEAQVGDELRAEFAWGDAREM